MNEKLLQFIWRYQYFNRQSLHTTEYEPIEIEKPGHWNHHQGPDFSEAVIRIGETRWAGNVELHLRSSDWTKHRHTHDARYSNIILHVVWEDDAPLLHHSGTKVPTVELKGRIPGMLLDRYGQIMETVVNVPCQPFLPALDLLGWTAWKESLAAGRLERRAAQILLQLDQSQQHWEQVCWQMLAANFGVRINAALFESMAQSLPLTIVARHRQQINQLEALLMGQANLLYGNFTESYPRMLQREYFFLRKKYKLGSVQKQPAYLRMRPAAFPTVRLAQLAMLLHRHSSLFSNICEAASLNQLSTMFMVTANDYWHYHYRFEEETAYQPKQLGKQMAENILINTAIPLLFTYGLYTKEYKYQQRALDWLCQLPAEQNQLTKSWQRLGVQHRCGLDSQALIELTNHYCQNKRCLDCAVGNRILKGGV